MENDTVFFFVKSKMYEIQIWLYKDFGAILKKGGSLAEIRDERTQRFIAMHAKMAKHGNHHWWIGAQILPDYQKVTY